MSREESELPAGYRHRPISLDDIEGIAAIWRRSDAALGLHPESPESFLNWKLRLPNVIHERDTLIVERGSEVVAFAVIDRDPVVEGSELNWFADVDPPHRDRGLGSWILGWVLGVASRRTEAEGSFPIQTMAPAPNDAARRLFEQAGLRRIRTMWDMHRDVRGYEQGDALPDGVAIRTFETGRDERTLWRVTEGAFAEHFNHMPTPFESFEARWWGSDDWHPERILLAESDGRIVGESAWVDSDPNGYIISVGVLPGHRGLGIAQALLRRAFVDIAAAGLPNATLSVDAENTTGAVELYRKVGMEPIRETLIFQRASS